MISSLVLDIKMQADEIIVSELGRRQRRFSATIGSRNDNFLRGFSDFGCSLNIPAAPPPPTLPPPPPPPPPPLALPLPILLVLELPLLSYKTLYCSGLVFCLCKILRLCIVEEEEEELVLVEFEFVVVFKLVVTRQLFSIVVLMSLAFSLLVLSASLLSSVGVLDFVSDFSDLRPRDHVRKSNALTIGLFGPEEESEELFDFHKLFFKFSLLVLVIGYNNKKLMCLRCLAYSYIAREIVECSE
ncbi:hypothetical protein GQX74_004157 [Glossina fuscipes]|nr:hypothetical protein GQX74_004157 [Glossina fuscipes]